MAKMLRSTKRFGRCKVPGHGQNLFCEVCQEIQKSAITRHQDKAAAKKEINEQLMAEILTERQAAPGNDL